MRVLVFHGYLLSGTGSNVYNAELAAAFKRAGHEVHLLCQDRDPLALDWVDAAGDWDGGSLAVTVKREPARATVYRPDIGGLLRSTSPTPTRASRRGRSRTSARTRWSATSSATSRRCGRSRTREADVALANHLVMGPAILARALEGVPYAVKVHGSALEYTVKRHPRFRPFAVEGLAGARGVLVGSRHTAESLWEEMDDP